MGDLVLGTHRVLDHFCYAHALDDVAVGRLRFCRKLVRPRRCNVVNVQLDRWGRFGPEILGHLLRVSTSCTLNVLLPLAQ